MQYTSDEKNGSLFGGDKVTQSVKISVPCRQSDYRYSFLQTTQPMGHAKTVSGLGVALGSLS